LSTAPRIGNVNTEIIVNMRHTHCRNICLKHSISFIAPTTISEYIRYKLNSVCFTIYDPFNDAVAIPGYEFSDKTSND
jgi:hypothetical protein